MAQTAFSVRMEDDLKREFSAFCENVGMNMSTAIVVFAKTVVRERQFPFPIGERPLSVGENGFDDIGCRARMAVARMRRRVAESSSAEPTLDEVNAFVSDVRARRRSIVQPSRTVRA